MARARRSGPLAVQAVVAEGLSILLVAVDAEASTHVDRPRGQGLPSEVVGLGGR